MASSGGGVWGIDIGQCALKAIRCRLGDDGESVVADAFDYIEYPKILNQPDEAEPEVMVRDALKQFLSRNSVRGDKVAISVSGQSGLARFIKLPPVDAKKIPDIVKYEAKQQIPFALEDVVWDYQQLAGGTETEGFALEAEVGLFAMKRDQVFRAIKPLQEAEIELDIIQLTPLSIYNYVVHDLIDKLPKPEEYDPENPPESLVVLMLGTDNSDLVVTNGYRVWQRNIPMGGNHFTKQLSKDMKLTFAKAEHLKRNARNAENAKDVFTAMRPIFNDLVTEVQRSIRHFHNIDRTAKIGKLVTLGNASKLPGLQQYLSKNLGYDVLPVEAFRKLQGAGVVNVPAFKENLLSFSVAYGLALQGLGKGKLSTNLLPREILTERAVRAKKPWVVAAVGLLMLGLAFNYLFHNRRWQEAHADQYKTQVSDVANLVSKSDKHQAEDKQQMADFEHLKALGEAVVGSGDRRLLWLELLKAIDQSLPSPKAPAVSSAGNISIADRARAINDRGDLHITTIESEYFKDLKTWWGDDFKKRYLEVLAKKKVTAKPKEGEAAAPAEDIPGPEGEGWVIMIKGYHYHNQDIKNQASQYLLNTIMEKLRDGKITLPVPMEGAGKAKFTNTEFSMEELGISHPIVVEDSRITTTDVRDPNVDPASADGRPRTQGGGLAGSPAGGRDPSMIPVDIHTFTIEFCWKPVPQTQRIEDRKKKQNQAEADRKEQANP